LRRVTLSQCALCRKADQHLPLLTEGSRDILASVTES
jgi:hypothetical protein